MPTVSETQEYFNKHSDRLAPEKLVDKWTSIAPMFADVDTDAHILECGAGTGLYTLPLLRAGYRVCSVDLSRQCLDTLQERARALNYEERLTTICGDFNEIAPTLSRKFDAATFIKVLHHFPDTASIQDGITLAYSALKPGGRILSFEPNGSCPFWYITLKILANKEMWANEKNFRLIRRRFFESIFRELPFATWSFDYRYFIPGSFIKRISALDVIDRVITRMPFINRFSGNLSFVVRKAD